MVRINAPTARPIGRAGMWRTTQAATGAAATPPSSIATTMAGRTPPLPSVATRAVAETAALAAWPSCSFTDASSALTRSASARARSRACSVSLARAAPSSRACSAFASSWPVRASSVSPITDTSDESFSSATKPLVIACSASRPFSGRICGFLSRGSGTAKNVDIRRDVRVGRSGGGRGWWDPGVDEVGPGRQRGVDAVGHDGALDPGQRRAVDRHRLADLASALHVDLEDDVLPRGQRAEVPDAAPDTVLERRSSRDAADLT